MPRVTTGRGDDGTTGVLGPERLPKDDPRIELVGALDETVSALGLARSLSHDARISEIIESVQRDLYRLMTLVMTTAGEPLATIGADDVTRLVTLQESLRESAPIASAFVIPGSTRGGAAIDLARSIVRRAERQAVTLNRAASLPAAALVYLNRCSDLLFVLARYDETRQGLTAPRHGRSKRGEATERAP